MSPGNASPMEMLASIKHHISASTIIVLVAVIIGMFFIAVPAIWPDPVQARAAGLAVITISLLATASIPEYLTALLLFLAAMLLGIAPPEVVFAGFQSTAIWLVFGGLVLGVAITSTGLGKRIANGLAGHLDGSYLWMVSGMTLAGMALAFIMPSALGRVALLVPITLALADHFGFGQGSNGRTGLVLAALLGSFVSAFAILPANVPNMVLAGMAENQFGMTLLYGEYLLLHFPVLGLLKLAMIVAAIVWIYPDRPLVRNRHEGVNQDPMQYRERLLSGVLAVLLVLWLTDFAHHVSPAWIALAGAVFLLMPGVGVVSTEQFNTRINYGSLFFVAGVIGLGSIIKHSGLGASIGQGLLAVLPLSADAPFVNFFSIALASTVTGLFTTLPGVPAVMVPLAGGIAEATAMPLETILMMQVVGFSAMLLPYQAPPIIVALQMAGIGARKAMRPLLLLALGTYTILLPLDYLWWKFLGRF